MTCTHVALSVLQNTTSLAKLEAGLTTLHHEPMSIAALLQQVGVIIRPQLASDVTLLIDVGAGVPRCVRADRKMLTHILINLAQNSARYTSVGHVTLACKLLRPAAAPAEVTAAATGAPAAPATATAAGVGCPVPPAPHAWRKAPPLRWPEQSVITLGPLEIKTFRIVTKLRASAVRGAAA